MKKILFIMILLCYLLFLKSNIYSRTLEQIMIELNPNEVGITFLYNDNAKGILLHHQNQSELLLLEAVNPFQFRTEFPVFHNLSLNHIFVLSEMEKSKIIGKKVQVLKQYSLDGIKLSNHNGGVEIMFEEQSFCIVTKKNVTLRSCDFIYLSNSDIDFHSSGQPKLMIYHSNVSNQIKLKHYNQWIDTFILPETSYTTFIWNHDEYEMVMIPK